MLDVIGEPLALALIGLFGGIHLGLAARLGRFCSLGAIEDALYAADTRRMRMWALAVGVAVTGTYSAAAFGWADIGASVHLSVAWNPLASIVGGLLFGYGMALAGNCGYGALARAGGGDIRAFVILLAMGLAAHATLSGPLAALRLAGFGREPVQGTLPALPQFVEATVGIGAMPIALLCGLALMTVALANADFRRSGKMVFWPVVVGLAVVSGWVGTTWVAKNGFAATAVTSHSFAAPAGETMLYLMTASGRSLSFGVGSVLGVIAGAFAGSVVKGHFRWEACEDPRELRRQILGAVLMGVGAAVALGCTVGQGLSAFSVLAFSAPVTAGAIFVGAAIGLRQLITGFMPAQ